MSSRKNHKPQALGSLFSKVLPQNYVHKRAEIDQLQQFFSAQQSDAVFGMVQVNNITDQYLHVSLPNATLSAYLRLHSAQIKDMLREHFNLDVELKISTRPSTSAPATGHKKKFPVNISQASCQQMQKGAESVEDDGLKAALKSLSNTLSQRSDQY